MKKVVAALCFASFLLPAGDAATLAPPTPVPVSAAAAAPSTPPLEPSQPHMEGAGTGQTPPPPGQPKPPGFVITGLLRVSRFGGKPVSVIAGKDSVGLNYELWVQIASRDTTPLGQIDASKYVLFLNGSEVKGLDPATLRAYTPEGSTEQRALAFKLKRKTENKSVWDALLGSPTQVHSPVAVSLAEKDTAGKTLAPSIFGDKEENATLNLEVISLWRLLLAAATVALVVYVLWGQARKNTTLRDSFLPQIEPKQQTYSLARWQMAFWFTLVFTSFIFLFFLTWDFNTVSAQALTLMGISGGTALAAVAVDVIKDSPADAVNRGLRALGLSSYDDVERLRQEISDKSAELAAKIKQRADLPQPAPPAQPSPAWSVLNQRILQLQSDVPARETVLRTYESRIRPFLTQGWFTDLTTDLNGSAVHRLQVFFWTWMLGFVFVLGVYRDLAMPEFSTTLLTLLGISSAGYVGFKYPEKNN